MPIEIPTGKWSLKAKVKKSTFIAVLTRTSSIQDAKEFIKATRMEHRRADHLPFGMRVGNPIEWEDWSDDKEPRGTAGFPIISVMRTRDVVNATLVVVRYFGGIKLGKGGLMRAYGKLSKEVLDLALKPS